MSEYKLVGHRLRAFLCLVENRGKWVTAADLLDAMFEGKIPPNRNHAILVRVTLFQLRTIIGREAVVNSPTSGYTLNLTFNPLPFLEPPK